MRIMRIRQVRTLDDARRAPPSSGPRRREGARGFNRTVDNSALDRRQYLSSSDQNTENIVHIESQPRVN